VGQEIAESECACQEACAANPQCETFTFDFTTGICSLTGQCDSVSICDSCAYGPPVCPRVCGDCYQSGVCQGIFAAVDTAPELCDCIDACRNNTACEYINYENSICTQLRDCKGGVAPAPAQCADCTTGPKFCPDCVDCSKPGKCQGQALDIFVAKDICECKNSCLNSTEGCAYISWDLINNTCTQTGTCNAIDTSCGEACSYMPNNCGNEGCGNCLYPGACLGQPVYIDFANSVCDCKTTCENFEACNFWTFDESTEVCTMTTDCDGGIDKNCAACTYGPKQCTISNSISGH